MAELIVGGFSLIASLGAICYAAIVHYRSQVHPLTLAKLETRIEVLERQSQQNEYISDQVANVLYDLFNLITVLKAYAELKEEGLPVSNYLFERSNEMLFSIEKHFAELGLFSRDEVRRKSVQQALVAKYGDMRTLDIMQEIMKTESGKSDKSLADAVAAIKKRLLSENGHSAAAWTGRPSGGAF